MAEYKVITAACLCGRHAFSTSVAKSSLPLEGVICHCYGCRHVCGTLGTAAIRWPSPTLPDVSALKRFDFSPQVWIYFCGTCGTNLFRHKRGKIDYPNGTSSTEVTIAFSVNVGVLDNPDDTVEITSHICVQGTRDGGWADFVPVIDNKPLPRWKMASHPAPKDFNDLLPIDWKLDPENGQKESDQILKAQCLCKGVEFLITRPSTVQVPGVKPGDEWWQVAGDRYPAGCCVCAQCRLASGGDVMHWTFIPKANIKMMDGSDFVPQFGTLASYRSSHEASRQFCSGCGCTIFYSADGRRGLLDVAAGILAAPSGARAEDWLAWRSWRISWENDAIHTKLRDALKSGLMSWGERQPEGSVQKLGKEDSIIAFKKLLVATDCDG